MGRRTCISGHGATTPSPKTTAADTVGSYCPYPSGARVGNAYFYVTLAYRTLVHG